jgi:hypothetical protein
MTYVSLEVYVVASYGSREVRSPWHCHSAARQRLMVFSLLVDACKNTGDLLSESTRSFTSWFVKTFLGVFHKLVGNRYRASQGPDLYAMHYREEYVVMPTSILSKVLSSLLPIVSIMVLYLVESVPKRFGIIAIFTAAFSLTPTIITTAKRPEISAATAGSVFAVVESYG